MSVHVSSNVWQFCPQKGSKRLVMLALADFCNDDGECWPSLASLEERTLLGRRNIQYLLDSLEQDGEFVRGRGHGRGHTSRYILGRYVKGANFAPFTTEKVQPVAPNPESEKVQPSAQKVQPSVIKGAIAIAPDPSVNRQEPSGAPKSPHKPPRDDQLMFGLLVDWLGYNLDSLTPRTRGRVNKLGAELRTGGFVLADVERARTWWAVNDWRGKKGQPPTIRQASECVEQHGHMPAGPQYEIDDYGFVHEVGVRATNQIDWEAYYRNNPTMGDANGRD